MNDSQDLRERVAMSAGARTHARPARLLVPPLLVLAAAWQFSTPASRAQHPVRTAQATPEASPLLATGLRLDPTGDAVELGSMPLGMALAPGGNQAVVVLSGWREQGIQVVDLASRRVTQTVPQDAAFYGLAFARDGNELYVSGGNDDSIHCYAWTNGAATPLRRIELAKPAPGKTGSRYPAGIAASPRGHFLYVAENVADSLAVVDLATSQVVQRFATDHYPLAVEATADGRVYVSAWGGDSVSTFRVLAGGTLAYDGRLRVGRHPSALLANASGSRLFVALASTDQIAVVDTRARRIVRTLRDSPPRGPAEGSTPNALALSEDGSRLYVAEADNNAVAVFGVATARAGPDGGSRPGGLEGRIPTDWYPTAVLRRSGQLLVLSGKGHGSHANPDGPIPGEGIARPLGYDLGQLNGTLRLLPLPPTPTSAALTAYTRRVAAANGWGRGHPAARYPPFKHVLYIIKENRTYDQVLGDLREGDGDPSLVYFGNEVSPNHHALARRFGLFDRFFTNAEVSSQGHLWSTAAYVTDYGEKTIPSSYADKREAVDGEAATEPAAGFLWTLAKQKGIVFRDYGEMVKADGGWPVTQAELAADVCPTYRQFDLHVADQARAAAWIAELEQFARDGAMPALELMHLAGDHTAGGRAGYRTPRAFMADNDLALGRIVAALSRSPFWKDTLVLVLEDDSQAGPDHVDSHRSVLLAISAYSRPGLVHRFVNTTDVVAAIEDVLGLGQLSKYDYFSRSLADLFVASPDLTPYTAIVPTVDMNEMNPPRSAAARMSEHLDLSAPDRVPDAVFNRILWSMMKGARPLPATSARSPLHTLQMSR
ncbi:MAG TPA: bifunctional YncE family protein/alkaline phosphatase family protein [Thermoanaerobaculia bacterium]|nr:bifunctional YncE family protein/alkaline phosphatase family protein [Thermoanaerobaculia bacterium]